MEEGPESPSGAALQGAAELESRKIIVRWGEGIRESELTLRLNRGMG